MEVDGLEHSANSLEKPHVSTEAAHNPAQLAEKWAVLLVNSKGQIQSKIASGESFASALAFAAGWQSKGQGESVAVVVPERS